MGARRTEALARKIAGIVAAEIGASPEDREVYEFALKLVIDTMLDVAVIFSLAYVFGVLRPVAVAYVLVAILKYFAGGAHASKMVNCLILGTIVYLGLGLAARGLGQLSEQISWAAFLSVGMLATVVFFRHAPVTPPNKPLKSVRHRNYLRKNAMITLGVVLAAMTIWLTRPFSSPDVFWSGLLALVWQSLILLPGCQRLFDTLERFMF